MNDVLEVTTLGGFQARLGGAPVEGLGGKAAALLVYLACARRPHPREGLAELLWNEREPGQARANLRVLLTRLPGAVASHLAVTRDTVAFEASAPFWLDLYEFERHLHAAWAPGREAGPPPPEAVAHLERAVALYGGPFMQGFYLHDGRGFESWMLAEQERLGRQVVGALHALVSAHLARGEHAAGLERAARLLELDPLDEEAHRQLLRLHAAGGQRAAALEQHERFRRQLGEELGAEPDPQTTALAERVRAGGLTGLAAPAPHPAPPPGLPPPLTPFVGREAELAVLAERLADPACRLVTVVGLGGSGKTRLALEAAGRLEPQGGVAYAPLAAVASPSGLAGAVAEAVGLAPENRDDPRPELLAWLRNRRMLLVLDSFEHLRGGEILLADLLGAAPELKLLVTSREPLHLRAEWLVDLGGLEVPPRDATLPVAGYDAVRLFVQSARRAWARFALTEAVEGEVARICRLVDGLPLGIELAASWVRTQDCATIAAEIERDLDFLASPLRDVPERHRSMRAVFEHSWSLLTDGERAGLRRLSVFRGGFEAGAAREVAEVEPRRLAALVDKALLWRTREGRYELHALLRQFAEEMLRAEPGEHDATRARHLAYYQAFAVARVLEPGPVSPDSWMERLEPDLDDVRAAVVLEPQGATGPQAQPAPAERGYPLHLKLDVVINRPLAEVFAFAANFENDPQWTRYTGIHEARCSPPGPIGAGTTVRWVIRSFGRWFESAALVTEYVPNARTCYHSTAGPMRFRSSRVFEACGEGTRLSRLEELDLGGFFKLVEPLIARLTRRALALELEYLKNLLEGRKADRPHPAPARPRG